MVNLVLHNPDISVEGVDAVRQILFLAICTLAAWLHLKCGLSRASTSRLLKVLSLIVHTAMELGRLLTTTNSLQQDKDNTTSLPPRLPSDVRSAMSALDIEPNIIRSICCPKCFSKYSLDSLPQTCLRLKYREPRFAVKNFGQSDQLEPVHALYPRDFTHRRTLSLGSNSFSRDQALRTSFPSPIPTRPQPQPCT